METGIVCFLFDEDVDTVSTPSQKIVFYKDDWRYIMKSKKMTDAMIQKIQADAQLAARVALAYHLGDGAISNSRVRMAQLILVHQDLTSASYDAVRRGLLKDNFDRFNLVNFEPERSVVAQWYTWQAFVMGMSEETHMHLLSIKYEEGENDWMYSALDGLLYQLADMEAFGREIALGWTIVEGQDSHDGSGRFRRLALPGEDYFEDMAAVDTLLGPDLELGFIRK